jgi:hypothetical protein
MFLRACFSLRLDNFEHGSRPTDWFPGKGSVENGWCKLQGIVKPINSFVLLAFESGGHLIELA